MTSASLMTWLFVRTTPFRSTMKPVPSPFVSRRTERRPKKGAASTSSPVVRIVTTLGSACFAMGAKLAGADDSRRSGSAPAELTAVGTDVDAAETVVGDVAEGASATSLASASGAEELRGLHASKQHETPSAA